MRGRLLVATVLSVGALALLAGRAALWQVTRNSAPEESPTVPATSNITPSATPSSTSTPVQPTVSGSIDQLVFVGPDGVLWLVNADGSGRVKLGGQCRGARALAWSPIGDALACQAQTSSIQVIDLTGSTVREIDDVLGNISSFWPPGIAWSPQGDSLAYQARDGSLKLAKLQGGPDVVLAPNAIPLAWPVAERLIVGLRVKETESGLLPRYEAYWLDLISGSQERISRLDNSRQFWVAPDGLRAVIVSGPARMDLGGAPLAVYDLRTNQELPVLGGAISYPSESIPIGQLAISANGTTVYWANANTVYGADMDGMGLMELGKVSRDFGILGLSRAGLSASVVPAGAGSPQKIVVENLEAKTTVEVEEGRGPLAWSPLS